MESDLLLLSHSSNQCSFLQVNNNYDNVTLCNIFIYIIYYIHNWIHSIAVITYQLFLRTHAPDPIKAFNEQTTRIDSTTQKNSFSHTSFSYIFLNQVFLSSLYWMMRHWNENQSSQIFRKSNYSIGKDSTKTKNIT